MTLTLPWPPSLNQLYRIGRRKIYMTDIGVNYKEMVARTARELNLISFEGKRVSLSVKAYPASHRRSDLDNLLKIIQDSLEKAVYNNDGQIDFVSVERMGVEKPGRVEITIKERQ